MKTFFLSGICLLVFSLKLNSQIKSYQLSYYFSINEVNSELNFKRLDSLNDLAGKAALTIKISGYTDFLSTSNYNKILSEKRADAVKAYLVKLSNASKISIQSCSGMGEVNSKETQDVLGEPAQRRVDLMIREEASRKKISQHQNTVQDKPANPEPPKTINELEKGETLTIEGLTFVPGRHALTPEAEPVIKEVLKTLLDHPELKVEIQGHICCLADEVDGLDFDNGERKLSENRAKAVYDYLIKNGVSKSRLYYKGFGHSHPKILIETSPEEEQMNRRVEIKILEN